MRVDLAIVEASAGTPLPGSPRSGSPPASAITLTSWPLGAARSSVHLEICSWFTSLINKQLGCHGGICSVSRFPARETALRPGRLGFLIMHQWHLACFSHALGGGGKHPPPRSPSVPDRPDAATFNDGQSCFDERWRSDSFVSEPVQLSAVGELHSGTR